MKPSATARSGRPPSTSAAALGLCLLAGGAVYPTLYSSNAMAVERDTAPAVPLDFAIAAGPLDQVLSQFARQAKIEFSADAQLTKGRQSRGLAGRYRLEEGLQVLLNGSGCVAQRQADGSFLLIHSSEETTLELPATAVKGAADASAVGSFNTQASPQLMKSNTPLARTPRSVTVLSRAVLDSQQVQSLSEALQNVPGVVAGQYGRRGFDDVIIRGQDASNALLVDGLRTSTTNRVAQQLFAMEQVEVLKGPASLEYGLVLPGGVVNMVSKRPQADPFAAVDLTYGSHNFKQTTFDVGTPLSGDAKAAFRLNGLAMDTDDATDHVWFKSRHIAPSLSLDLGDDTNLTLLASHQEREYIRQQGLPLSGSLRSNPNGNLPRHLFIGEPGQGPYDATEDRLGYALTHWLANDWVYRQNFRWQGYSLEGLAITSGALAANGRLLTRSGLQQDYRGDTLSFDNHLQKVFDGRWGEHELTTGFDYLRSREHQVTRNCAVSKLDLFAPVYGKPVVCPAKARTDRDSTVRMLGGYVRDNVRVGEKWNLTGGLRYDTTDTYSVDQLSGNRTGNTADAVSGAVGAMYELYENVRPYISYSTSFYPNSGSDAQGRAFKPEEGRQWEAGVKFDLQQGRTLLTLALFDMRRENVLQDDPANDGFSLAIGEQRTRGAELAITSDVTDRLSIMGGYAYTAAVVTDDGGNRPSTQGEPLDNVSRHSASLHARYRFGDTPQGWTLSGGFKGESRKFTNGYSVPGYVVANAGLAYEIDHWRAALNLKNLFDKHYYSGGTARAVAMGDERTLLVTLGYRY